MWTRSRLSFQPAFEPHVRWVRVFCLETGNRQWPMRVRIAVLQEKPRIYEFKGICAGIRKICSTTEMPERFVFQGLASLGIRVFEPGGQGFESLRAHFSKLGHAFSPRVAAGRFY
jgi:hypothetical protein